ncbi:MAG: hypothetical protein ACRDSZ_02705, partial [Pseudonocardiaceae bacterium]
ATQMTITSPELAVPNPPRREHARQVNQQLRAILISAAVGKLECNPAGQWGWLAEETGLPIAEAIADELVRAA